ncbi:MAG: carboxyl transferase domain-containing protein, partial [Pirellulales bacterium]
KAFDPRFMFAWPTARTAVMGGEQATSTLLEVSIKSLERQGQHVDAAELEALRERVTSDYNRQMDPRYAAARGWVDRIIDPAWTREELIYALELATRHPGSEAFKLGVFQV